MVWLRNNNRKIFKKKKKITGRAKKAKLSRNGTLDIKARKKISRK